MDFVSTDSVALSVNARPADKWHNIAFDRRQLVCAVRCPSAAIQIATDLADGAGDFELHPAASRLWPVAVRRSSLSSSKCTRAIEAARSMMDFDPTIRPEVI